jgi:hypothetical protein
MSLYKGSAKVQVSKVFGQARIADAALEQILQQAAFHPIADNSTIDSSVGIVSWQEPSRAPENGETFLADSWVVFGFREDKKKVAKARIELAVQEMFAAHRAAGADGKFNFKGAKEMAKIDLLRSTPATPAVHMVALNLQKGILLTEGKVRTRVQGLLGPLGLHFEDIEYVANTQVLLNLKQANPVGLGDDRPEGIPETLQYVVMDSLDLKMGDQKMTARKVGEELKKECSDFMEEGAEIIKLQVEFALAEDAVYKVALKPNMETISLNPGKPAEGNRIEVLLWRLDKLVGLQYILGKLA